MTEAQGMAEDSFQFGYNFDQPRRKIAGLVIREHEPQPPKGAVAQGQSDATRLFLPRYAPSWIHVRAKGRWCR